MSGRHFIITGTSRGIGERLAEMLLEQGDFVHGISRGTSAALTRYAKFNPIRFDLADTERIERMLDNLLDSIDLERVSMLTTMKLV
jgi:benzil reductase ((S)-benzoin forming)